MKKGDFVIFQEGSRFTGMVGRVSSKCDCGAWRVDVKGKEQQHTREVKKITKAGVIHSFSEGQLSKKEVLEWQQQSGQSVEDEIISF